MTLPKGFGSGGEQECNTCGKDFSRYAKECPHCIKANKKYNIPISKLSIGMFFFHISFYGGALAMLISSTFIPNMFIFTIGLISVFVSTLVMLLGTLENYRDGWKIRSNAFFIFVPLVDTLKKFSFKHDD